MACERILIIEDETDLRETLRDLLEMEGFKADTAANGREGLRVLQEIRQPCLILLDLMMPVMNGWEFLEALRRQPELLPETFAVVVVSAAADVMEVQQQYGCQVLKKPVKIDQLIALAHAYCCAA